MTWSAGVGPQQPARGLRRQQVVDPRQPDGVGTVGADGRPAHVPLVVPADEGAAAGAVQVLLAGREQPGDPPAVRRGPPHPRPGGAAEQSGDVAEPPDVRQPERAPALDEALVRHRRRPQRPPQQRRPEPAADAGRAGDGRPPRRRASARRRAERRPGDDDRPAPAAPPQRADDGHTYHGTSGTWATPGPRRPPAPKWAGVKPGAPRVADRHAHRRHRPLRQPRHGPAAPPRRGRRARPRRRGPAAAADGEPYQLARWVAARPRAEAREERLREVFAGADAVVHLAWGFQPSHVPDYLDRVGIGGTAARPRGRGRRRRRPPRARVVARRLLPRAAAGRRRHAGARRRVLAHRGHRVARLQQGEGRPPSGCSTATRRPAAAGCSSPGCARRSSCSATPAARSCATGCRRSCRRRRSAWSRCCRWTRDLVIQAVHTDDVADAIARALERRPAARSTSRRTRRSTAHAIAAALGARLVPDAAGGAARDGRRDLAARRAAARPRAGSTWRSRCR